MKLVKQAEDLVILGEIYDNLADMVVQYRPLNSDTYAALNRSLMEARSWVATAETNLKAIIDEEEAARRLAQ